MEARARRWQPRRYELILLLPALVIMACRAPGRLPPEGDAVVAGTVTTDVSAQAPTTTPTPSNDAGPAEGLPGAASATDAGAKETETDMNDKTLATDPDTNRRLGGLLRDLTMKIPPARYTPLVSVDELKGRVNSPGKCWALFRPEADPYKVDPPAKAAFHVDPDRLRLEYEALGMRILVVQDPNLTLVRVISADVRRLLQMKPDEQIAAISRIFDLLFKLKPWGRWVPRLPFSSDEALAFSTNPSYGIIPMGGPWGSRVDSGVFKGELYYMLYESYEGKWLFYAPPTGWFSKEFLAEHRVKAK